MLLSVKWLNELIEVPEDVEKLEKDLTNCGLKVDEIHRFPLEKEGLLVGKIVECEKHPEADKLQICKVDTGDKIHQVICGAPNARSGLKVVLATVGYKLPAFEVVSRELRGVMSNGVLVSEKEINISDEHGGIIELPDHLEIGSYYADYYNSERLNLELDITANRGDALSILGIARDCVALYDKKINSPYRMPEELGKDIDFSIEIEAPELCPRYSSRIIRNVEIKESPVWLKEKLRAVGSRPINNVVDITNYILFLTGHPMHAFDLAKLEDNKIVVRGAKKGEKIITLDEVERELEEDYCLICDGKKAVAIGGVMGGLNSEVSADTKELLLEVAIFDPKSVRKTSKKLGLKSDSSHRFERGIDFNDSIDVLNLAAAMIEELAGGITDKGIIDIYPEKLKKNGIKFSPERARKFLGAEIDDKTMFDILNKLQFNIEKSSSDNEYLVTPPSFRNDVEIEVEIIEEIIRIYGYNNVPSTLPCSSLGTKIESEYWYLEKIRDFLSEKGFYEICLYGFLSKDEVERYNIKKSLPISLLNPLGQEFSTMRTDLIPSMFKTITLNNSKGNKDFALFEIGKTSRLVEYNGEIKNIDVVIKKDGKNMKVEEEYSLCIAMDMPLITDGWNLENERVDYFDFKFYVEELFKYMGEKLEVEKLETPYFFLHPGIAAKVMSGNEEIGFMGKIHPVFAKEEGLSDNIFIMEMKLSTLFKEKGIKRVSEISKYPAALFDLALVLDRDVSHKRVVNIINKMGGEFLKEVTLFDLYDGERIAENKKSLAYSLKFQADDRTLTDVEIKNSVDNIFKELEKEVGATLRVL